MSDGGSAASGTVKHAYVLLLSRSHKLDGGSRDDTELRGSTAAGATSKRMYYDLKRFFVFFSFQMEDCGYSKTAAVVLTTADGRTLFQGEGGMLK